MMQQSISDFHAQYMDVTRHWCPYSEPFTGGDALITALHDGWEMSDTVRKETHWYAGMRFVNVYYFELSRENEVRVMPVIDNPYIANLVFQMEFQLQKVETRD